MENRERKFRESSGIIAFNEGHRKVLGHNLAQYDQAVGKGMLFFSDWENARTQASKIKSYSIQELENLLVLFEKNARDNGSEVYWASGQDDVMQVIQKVIVEEDVNKVVKMKSMITEELEINSFLEKMKVEVYETDLGEFIVQVAGEKPYHILTPAMHKSRHDVAELFTRKFGLEPGSSPEKITVFVREYLRSRFMTSEMGITGANFLVAETGSVALTENEGNGMMTFSWPPVLVVIAGIEKIIPDLGDLSLFWPLAAVSGTGQIVSAYNSILAGPVGSEELDGPRRMIIILYDGGRTRIAEANGIREVLNCIRCGACLSACPVYRTIGGYSYQTTYSGPVGSVISMYLDDTRDAGFLNYASSLCGKCTEVCPVRIPLHKLLLQNRASLVEKNSVTGFEKLFFRNFKRMMLKRSKMDSMGPSWKNRALKSFGQKVWGPRRIPLRFARESFNQMWRKKTH